MKINKNRYYKRSRIAEKKFREILRCFALDLSAADTARLIGISIQSVNNIFIKLRIRGKRGRVAGSKTIVFGLFKRNGWVCTEIVPDARKRTLQRVIPGKVSLDSIIHADGWHGLVDMDHAKHYRIEHGSNEFAND